MDTAKLFLRTLLDRAIAKGFGDADYSALFEAVNPPDVGGPSS